MFKRAVQKVVDTLPLHDAARNCDSSRVKSLLDRGIDSNLRNTSGDTPLHCLLSNAFLGHFQEKEMTECTRLLLSHGADFRVTNGEGHSPLAIAVKNKLHPAIRLLLKAGANCIGWLVAEMPDLVLERFDDGVSFYQTSNEYGIRLDWRPVVGYSGKSLDKLEDGTINLKTLPPESKFLSEILTVDTKNSEVKERILSHPLVKAFIHMKTKSVPKVYHLLHAIEILYIILAAAFIMVLYFDRCRLNDDEEEPEPTSTPAAKFYHIQQDDPSTSPEPDDRSTGTTCEITLTIKILCYGILVYTGLLLLRDVYLIYFVGVEYLLSWRHWVWRISLIVNVVIVYPGLTDHAAGYNLTFQYPLASVGILFISVLSLLQMEAFHNLFAIYVEIFAISILTVLKLCLMFLPVIMGFFAGFNLMFPEMSRMFTFLRMSIDPGSDHIDVVDEETDWDSYAFEFIAKVFAVTFLLVICVGFMNYVLAMSIDDVQRIKRQAKVSRIARQIKYLLLIDQMSRSAHLIHTEMDLVNENAWTYQYECGNKKSPESAELSEDITIDILMLLKSKKDGQDVLQTRSNNNQDNNVV